MKDTKLKRLEALGAERLADALLELAVQNDEAADLVERLIATQSENRQRFTVKLEALRHRQHFIDWREASDFAHKLELMLEDLKSGTDDPETGVELTAAFFEADGAIFHQSDDSNGSIGDVFRHDARNLFVHYASRYDNKARLCELLIQLYENDEYGVRDVLIECASRYLPRTAMRNLAEALWHMAQKAQDEYQSGHYLMGVEMLARQMKDAGLFEKACRAKWPELPVAGCLDIAGVYLETGDARTALKWVERTYGQGDFRAHERSKLLLDIYTKLGDKEKASGVAWEIFRACRSADTFDELLQVIGNDQQEEVLNDEVGIVLGFENFSTTDAAFLIEIDRIDAAEIYLLKNTAQFNGDLYTGLLPLAESMEHNGCFIAASAVYRALLDSLLRRAQSKYYHHGVRYLRKLDSLAKSITDWKEMQTHGDYKKGIAATHSRKRSFWKRYNGVLK